MNLIVQTNNKHEVPTKQQSKPIIELEEIVKSTNQEHKVMNFLTTDHKDPILWVDKYL